MSLRFFNENGKVYSFNKFREKYNVNINFLSYAGIKACILSHKNRNEIDIKDNKHQDMSLCFTKLFSIDKGTRVYGDIFNENNEEPKCCKKWDMKLANAHDWKKCFNNIRT